MDIVYYHGGCTDGWASAYVALRKYPNAQLIPLSYGIVDFPKILEEVRGKDVLMVDFSLKTREMMDQIAGAAKSFLVLDHHKTALAMLQDAPYAIFDMKRSGAGLTWDYLFGEDSDIRGGWTLGQGFSPRPWWVNYAEDADLWLFRLPRSRAINAWLHIQDKTILRWDCIQAYTSGDSVASLGDAILESTAEVVRRALKNMMEGELRYQNQVLRVGVVNTAHAQSDIGEAIYKLGYDVAMMWYEGAHGLINFGLRSDKVDVGAIAKQFPGGGGHRAASGFELSIGEGRALLDEILGRVVAVGKEYAPFTRCS